LGFISTFKTSYIFKTSNIFKIIFEKLKDIIFNCFVIIRQVTFPPRQ
jgi:hypothetical protein